MKKYAMLMTPVSKEIIWGGDKLKKEYGKTAPFDKIAESWELTVRDGEMCVIANGEYSGKTMGEYIAEAAQLKNSRRLFTRDARKKCSTSFPYTRERYTSSRRDRFTLSAQAFSSRKFSRTPT